MIEYSFSMADLEYFLLIFSRVSCLIFIAPFYSTTNTPARIRIGLSIFVALLLYQVLPVVPLEYSTIMGYATMVLKEAAVGLLMGFGCNICIMILSFSGRIIDMETGLSMASLMDPLTKEQTSISGMLYQYAVMLILMISGMYQYIMKALAESFTLIPINGAIFRPDGLMKAMVGFMSDYIFVAFRICLPIFTVMIMLNAILGILAKVAPQMNMFAVGIQFKVLTGLTVLFITTGMLPRLSELIFTEMKTMMVTFVETMM
ncbi:MAG: flagellar biosynthetic protein FliR [Lachnospiraceae bacterium]|nr:flagellar biosynthetic protein FliR [Lachnospiraceae bacterium]